jgi:hypothetical protein
MESVADIFRTFHCRLEVQIDIPGGVFTHRPHFYTNLGARFAKVLLES